MQETKVYKTAAELRIHETERELLIKARDSFLAPDPGEYNQCDWLHCCCARMEQIARSEGKLGFFRGPYDSHYKYSPPLARIFTGNWQKEFGIGGDDPIFVAGSSPYTPADAATAIECFLTGSRVAGPLDL